jgi:uncharacterized membrane protein YkvA (DUF1232 family)
MRQATNNLAYLAGAAVSVLYLLNPGAGVVELLPDNLPLVGNLDEAAFIGLLLGCVRGLRRSREESGTTLTRA